MKCPKDGCGSSEIIITKHKNLRRCYTCGYAGNVKEFAESGDFYQADRERVGQDIYINDLVEIGDEPTMDKGEKYRKTIVGKTINTGAIKKYEAVVVDVYDVLVAFKVTDPAIAHAVKKLLATGQRGHKDKMTDLKEAHWQLERAMHIEERYSGN